VSASTEEARSFCGFSDSASPASPLLISVYQAECLVVTGQPELRPQAHSPVGRITRENRAGFTRCVKGCRRNEGAVSEGGQPGLVWAAGLLAELSEVRSPARP
jgi:hypothetical protein